MLRLLTFAVACGSASAFVAPAHSAIRPNSPRVALQRRELHCSAANDDDSPPPPPPLTSFDISREIAKYDSAGLRFRQSGPIRKTVGAAMDFFGEAGALARFLRGAVSVFPFYGMMMVALLVAFGLQQSAPRAAMVAGARVNAAILRGGQWHRLVSPVFLHGGGMHLASNLFSLFRVGPLVEASYGAGRAALLYLLSGIGGNVAGLYFGAAQGMSVGASGAVFGLMGATGGYVLRNKVALGRYGDMLLRNVLQILALNLYIGTRRGSGIDNLAHLGGFVTGSVFGVLLAPDVGRSTRRPRGRYDYNDGADARDDGDGTLLPAWAVRALLAATTVAYVAGLREATTIAIAVHRFYGGK